MEEETKKKGEKKKGRTHQIFGQYITFTLKRIIGKYKWRIENRE